MVFTVGLEWVAVLGLGGAGGGVGVYLDTERFTVGPYAYALAGAGFGAYGGGVVELGVYRSMRALRGLSLEVGGAGAGATSYGLSVSLARRGAAGAAASVGVGAGLAAWALGGLCGAGRARPSTASPAEDNATR